MALASTTAATVEGITAHVVTIEANVGPGLPGMHMVGLGDAAVKESRERIRTAITNSALPWPRTKIMVSLSPAHLPKAGSHFDLPIALAVLGCLDPAVQLRLDRVMVLGELALNGSLRRVEGVLPMLIAAQEAPGVEVIVVPRANAAEAALLGRGNVLVADTLAQVWAWLHGEARLEPVLDFAALPEPIGAPDFRDLAGLAPERHALEVAAAGGHHVMMIGPPGSGKSMLAERLPSILPPLELDEMVEVTAIHAAAGISEGPVAHRPFIAPHPSLTRAALIGGGSGAPVPGAVSQAHHGVLFLDEASEIPAQVLDALRIPLEKREVRFTRAKRDIIYPADVQLVMAANPCACQLREGKCVCRSDKRARHLRNISGPLRDRLDVFVRVTGESAVVSAVDAEPSSVIAERVAAARERAAARWATAGLTESVNSRVAPSVIRRHFPADEVGMALLESHLARRELTQRGVDRCLKLAWTLADLDGAPQPDIDQVARAVDMRSDDVMGGAVYELA